MRARGTEWNGRPIAIRRDIHVGADDADADRVADPVIARGYRGFDAAALCVGGPEEVTASFADLAEMGFTDVIVRHLADDHTEVLKSYERLSAGTQPTCNKSLKAFAQRQSARRAERSGATLAGV